MNTRRIATQEPNVNVNGERVYEIPVTSSNQLDGRAILSKRTNPTDPNVRMFVNIADKLKETPGTLVENEIYESFAEFAKVSSSSYAEDVPNFVAESNNGNATVLFDEDWKKTLKDCNDAIEATLNSQRIDIENEEPDNHAQAVKMHNETTGNIQSRDIRLNTEEIEKNFLDDLINSDNDQDDVENDTFYTACGTPPQKLILDNELKSNQQSLQASDIYTTQAMDDDSIAACSTDERLSEPCFIRKTAQKPDIHEEIPSINLFPKLDDVPTKSNSQMPKLLPVIENKFKELEDQITKHQVVKKYPANNRYRRNTPTSFETNIRTENCTYSIRGKKVTKNNIGCISSVNHMSKCEFNTTRVLHKPPYISSIPSDGGTIYVGEINTEFGKITQKVKRAYIAHKHFN